MMTKIDNSLMEIRSIQAELANKLERVEKAFGGGGGGGASGLEKRIDRIEARLDKASDELHSNSTLLATLTERVSHLPGKGFIVAVVMSGMTLFAAIIVFGEKIKALLG